MNVSRQRQLLDGQTSVARKVFCGIPIQEAWDENAITREIRGAGNSMAISAHAVRSCLYDLKDAGLVREPSRGHFQRTPVTVKEPKVKSANIRNSSASAEAQPVGVSAESAESATIHPEKPMAHTLTRNPTPAQTTPLDVLGTIAIDLTVFSTEFTARMKALSERVEDCALLVEAQREADAATMAKANQLQSLIKEMAGHL